MLERADIEALADALAPRVAELLRGDDEAPFPSRGLVDADRVARFLSVDRAWVYDHKIELGAVRIGGETGRALRFEAAQVLAYVRRRRLGPEPTARRARPGPRHRGAGSSLELLPLPGGVR